MVMNSFNHIYIDFLVRCLFEKVCDNSTNSLFLSSLPNLSKSCMALLTITFSYILKSLLNVWP